MPLDLSHRRQFQRRTCDLAVQLTIAESSRGQVAPIAGPSLRGRLTNISGGGAQILVATFIPRATQVFLHVAPEAGLPDAQMRCRVMTVRMSDAEPHYSLGLRFEDADSSLVHALRAATGQEASV